MDKVRQVVAAIASSTWFEYAAGLVIFLHLGTPGCKGTKPTKIEDFRVSSCKKIYNARVLLC